MGIGPILIHTQDFGIEYKKPTSVVESYKTKSRDVPYTAAIGR